VLRYPNVFGPRQDPHGEAGVVAIFIEKMLAGEQPTIFGDGTKTRDYVYIDDVVAANLLAIDAKVDVYNLGWGKEVSDYQVFCAVRDALGVTVEPHFGQKRHGEIDRVCLDSQRISHDLGWRPRVSLEEGVARTIQWHKQRRQKAPTG
jgi:UDP-glucose 4-epimerase